MNLYQKYGKKKVWGGLGMIYELEYTTAPENTWLITAIGHLHLINDVGRWRDSVNCCKVDFMPLTNGQEPKASSERKPKVLKVKEWNILHWLRQEDPQTNKWKQLHYRSGKVLQKRKPTLLWQSWVPHFKLSLQLWLEFKHFTGYFCSTLN